MQVARIPIDGLLRCLCPSIDSLASSYSARLLSPRKCLPRPRRTQCLRTQQFSTAPVDIQRHGTLNSNHTSDGESTTGLKPPNSSADTAEASIKITRSVRYGLGVEYTGHTNGNASGSQILSEKDRAVLDSLPTGHLHEQLRAYRFQEGGFDMVVKLVTYLIKSRGEKPALVHYESLIRINANAEKGSARSVRALLEEMEAEGIGADSGVYHGALQALAVHPDYVLQAEIMAAMKERWLGLSPEGWHNFVVGLLRDRQLERAMDSVAQMQQDGVIVQPWLYDILLYQLCEAGELDDAFGVLQYRSEHSNVDIQPGIWYYLLDSFSRAFHYEGTKFIWQIRVDTMTLNPSDGICVAVLNLAARNADPALATSIIEILTSRRTLLSPFHYEALIDAYIGTRDLNTAFRILSIMVKAGQEPNASSTRPLFLYLSQDIRRAHAAWEVLHTLVKNDHQVHIAAVNVVLEAAVSIGDIQAAIQFYNELHLVVLEGPNTDTINTLLKGAYEMGAGGKDLAMFLAKDMVERNIKADQLTYDRLIITCLRNGDFDDAFRYLEEMEDVGKASVENGQKGWWMRVGTANMLVRECIRVDDQRAFGVIDAMRARGMDVVKWERTVREKNEGAEEVGIGLLK